MITELYDHSETCTDDIRLIVRDALLGDRGSGFDIIRIMGDRKGNGYNPDSYRAFFWAKKT